MEWMEWMDGWVGGKGVKIDSVTHSGLKQDSQVYYFGWMMDDARTIKSVEYNLSPTSFILLCSNSSAIRF
jgi:hypothetical protein